MFSTFIKSPLNYTGNKYRILNQIEKYFPTKIHCMMDLFCGGATVGINTNADNVIFVDCNERVLNLLDFLSKQDFDNFLNECENIITKYSLSYSYKYGYRQYRTKCSNLNDNNGLKDYNSNGFYKLRDDYNNLKNKNSTEANYMLYILMAYGFNNDLRFNKFGDYNLPIGKTDLNKNNVNKIQAYIERSKKMNISFICSSFESDNIVKLLDKVDFVYMDPPYLIGNAVYNSYWNIDAEKSLLNFIDTLILKKINFALSNITQKKEIKNVPLLGWCEKNKDIINIIPIDYHYRSASYHKKIRDSNEQEVLIINKVYENDN